MAKKVFLLTLLAFLAAAPSRAGDEDVKAEKAKKAAQQAEPEAMPLPPETEAPPPALMEEEVKAPIFTETEEVAAPMAPSATPQRRAVRELKDPDKNLDYSELLALAQPMELSRGILPPALGTRGYRPNLVAVSVGDRTPGYGALVEYSFNRIGVGTYFSYRNLTDYDTQSVSQTFFGLYGLYRWLPFDFSPYILMGVELGSQTRETLGGLAGLGMEARIYSGWTLLVGWTFHSTARKGFFGGGFGWSF
jgi:hypothetical protein